MTAVAEPQEVYYVRGKRYYGEPILMEPFEPKTYFCQGCCADLLAAWWPASCPKCGKVTR